jgi:hypothetical protein
LKERLKNGTETDWRVRDLIEEVLEEARRLLTGPMDKNSGSSAEPIDLKAERANEDARARGRGDETRPTQPDPTPQKPARGDPMRGSGPPARRISKVFFYVVSLASG